jgi:hypothetical protein
MQFVPDFAEHLVEKRDRASNSGRLQRLVDQLVCTKLAGRDSEMIVTNEALAVHQNLEIGSLIHERVLNINVKGNRFS